MSTKLDFGPVSALLSDSDRGARDSIRGILQAHGFRNIETASSVTEIGKKLESPTLDLLISGCDFRDGDLFRLINKLRHSELGTNPFVAVIITTWNPAAELVQQVIDSGADDLLPMPLSTERLLSRIETLVKNRKPFVVTTDYVGPDRRSSSDRPSDIPLIEAPNTLASKMAGEKDEIAILEAVERAVAEVNLHKLERHAAQISWLVERILPVMEGGGGEEATIHLVKMIYVCRDIDRRLQGTEYAHISGLCQSMFKVATSLKASVAAPKDQDIKLLAPLAQAIQQSFSSRERDSAAAWNISKEI